MRVPAAEQRLLLELQSHDTRIARLTHERGTATMLVTHDLVHRESLDDLVTVVDGAITAPAAPRHPTDAVAVG